MKKADKFILSTKFEGLPTVLIEALTVNDNVISADCKSGPSEILDNGKYGYLFPIGDAKQLAELILNSEPKDRVEIDNHLQIFSQQSAFQKLEQIINCL